MPNRTEEFELDGDSIELEISYSPDETITLPSDLAEKIKRYALDVVVPRWIKEIENQAMNMELDCKVEEWLEEDAKGYAEDKAAAQYDRMKEDKGQGVW